MPTLREKLGFDPITGGRRLGELRITAIDGSETTVFLEMPGSVVTIEQAQLIRRALIQPNA